MELVANLKKELNLANGFKIKLAILTFRIGFCLQYVCESRLLKLFLNVIYKFLKVFCLILSCGEIPSRTVFIGWGLNLPHGFSGTSINYNAKIGKNCVIYSNVILGQIDRFDEKGKACHQDNLIIGDNVYIGTSSLLIGNVTIGDNCKIGAGTKIINDNIPSNSTVVTKFENKIIV